MSERFKGKRVGVLYGGLSAEREVSLKTGSAVLKALQSRGYDAVGIDAGRDLAAKLSAEGVEVAWVALHGAFGEDGAVQGLLEVQGIPYTGSGVAASAVAMDKHLAKTVFLAAGLSTPHSISAANVDAALERAASDEKYVVKPTTTGSTIGIHIVEAGDAEGLKKAVTDALSFSDQVLLEQFIDGKELTVSVLAGQILPSIEIVPPEGFYDYDAKYTYAHGKTEYVIPARVGAACAQQLESITRDAWSALGCEGFGRADFIVDEDETPWLLEVNTVPGMTETSLVPKAAAHVGIEFDQLVEQILDTARLKLREGK